MAKFLASIKRQSLAGWCKLPRDSQQAHHLPKPVLSSKSMNFSLWSPKKSYCWLWLAVDFIFGKVLGFVCGRRTIKTGKVLWQRLKYLPTMGYGMGMLKGHESFIPHANYCAGKALITQSESLNFRLRHYLARFHRKILCYSKSRTMLEVPLKLPINKLNNP